MNAVLSSRPPLPSQILEVPREGTTVDIELDTGDTFTVFETEEGGTPYLVLEVHGRQGDEGEAEPRRRVIFDRLALAHERGSHTHLTMRVSFPPTTP